MTSGTREVDGLADAVGLSRRESSVADVSATTRLRIGELYDECAQFIYRYLLARTGRADIAEDLTSQTFVAAMQALASYRGTGTPRAWLVGIARRKWIDLQRQRAHERPLRNLTNVVEPESQSPYEIVVGRLELARVIEALSWLTPDRREAVALRIFASLTAREAGKVMGKSEGAVKMLVHRGLRDLRDQLTGTTDD